MPYMKPQYEATRTDVLVALPSPPTRPGPFGENERPWTLFQIAERIAQVRHIPLPDNVGKVIECNRLHKLIRAMADDGSLVGRPRHEWAAMGRPVWPEQGHDMLYAHPDLVACWIEGDYRKTPSEG